MFRSAAPRPFLTRLRHRTAGEWAGARGAAALTAALTLAAGPGAQAQTPEVVERAVNTYTTGPQHVPAIASNATGDYVVAWQSEGQDGSGYGVYARRYGTDGAPRSEPFQVNTTTERGQTAPSVGVAADGSSVVVWQSERPSTFPGDTTPDVYGQRYDPDGVAVGGEFRVNGTFAAREPEVAMDAAGGFVVVWMSGGIYARRFAASGDPLGAEFRVNTYTTGAHDYPAVASDGAGDFVVTWQSYGQDGDGEGIYARAYDADGAPRGGELQVNTYTTSTQLLPSVGMSADGDFVVAWGGVGDAADGLVLAYARRYTAAGEPLGGAFAVDASTTELQAEPAVAVEPAGNFTVVWHGPDGGGPFGMDVGVYARRFRSDGALDSETGLVNTYTTGIQVAPVAAADAGGGLLVAWGSDGQDGSDYGVYLRARVPPPVAVEGEGAAGFELAVEPNPVTGGGAVGYTLPSATRVRVALYDVLGREVAVLAEGEQGAGRHEAALQAGSLAPGAYLVRLTAGEAALVQRVTVAR